ncbi:uncharacterized protein LOC124655382 [Lolium rigidum]|uniref:uncharacterized protein LOC124655382 n=1 Tax=Lolium rigidum TaxID=89674 RepID=UPI001F5DFD40|nr:uncharacterized protein LOC124655382 [Lolium rigidum]
MAAAAAHLLSSPPVTSGLPPRPSLWHHRRTGTRQTEATGSISCRATLGPDGHLSALAAPGPAAATGRTYLREHSCLLFPPPRGRRPLAVVKFLGGAFIGAVPEATYGYLLELLAQEGFLVVCVPYNVTFDHAAAAREVFQRFHGCYDELLALGLPEAGLTALQLLVGSYFSEKIPKANAIVSFNNRPASEAVPYFEQIGPLFSQLMPMMEASPVYSVARDASGGAWKALFDLAGGLIQEYDQEAMASVRKFVDQLPYVMNQVTEGVSEFKPTPPENREFCKNSYSVPNTLLVKISVDAIDDTDIIENILRPRVESINGQVKKVTLSGTHLTPCIQDVKWQAGSQYTPADALAQGLKSLALNETRVLSRTIADWFRSI